MAQKKSHIILSSILGVLVFVFIVQSLSMNTNAQTADPLIDDQSILAEEKEMNSFIAELEAEAPQTGTSFQFGDISISTDDTVSLVASAADQSTVHLSLYPDVQPAAASINVTVNNLKSSFDYYLYRDGLHPDPEIATTDANGSVTVNVATDAVHLIYLQDAKSTYVIDASGGACDDGSIVGASWIAPVCTLPAGTLTDTILIDAPNITLEGNGAIIDISTGSQVTGLALSSIAHNATIRDLTVTMDDDNEYGVDLGVASNFNLDNVDVNYLDTGSDPSTFGRSGIRSIFPYATSSGFSITNTDIVDSGDLAANNFAGITIFTPVGGFIGNYSFDSTNDSITSRGVYISGSVAPVSVQQDIEITNATFSNGTGTDRRGNGIFAHGNFRTLNVDISNADISNMLTAVAFVHSEGSADVSNIECLEVRTCSYFQRVGQISSVDTLTADNVDAGVSLGFAPWPAALENVTVTNASTAGVWATRPGGSTEIVNANISDSSMGLRIYPFSDSLDDTNVRVVDSEINNTSSYSVFCKRPTTVINCTGSGNTFSKAPSGWTGGGYIIAGDSDVDSDGVGDLNDLFVNNGDAPIHLTGDYTVTSIDSVTSSVTVGNGGAQMFWNGTKIRGNATPGSRFNARFASLGIEVLEGSVTLTDDITVKALLAIGDDVSMDDDGTRTTTTILAGAPLVELFEFGGQAIWNLTSGSVSTYFDVNQLLVTEAGVDSTIIGIEPTTLPPLEVTVTKVKTNGKVRGKKQSLFFEYASGNLGDTLDSDILDITTGLPVAKVSMELTQAIDISADLVNSVTSFERVDSNGALDVTLVSSDGNPFATFATTGGESFDLAHSGSIAVSIVNTGTASLDILNLNNGLTTTVNPGDTAVVSPGPIGTIESSITSNVKTSSGGQEPLAGALVKAFNVDDACAASYIPDSNMVSNNCTAVSTCTTDANGQCSIDVPAEESYFLLTEEPNHRGILPSHSLGIVKEGEFKNFVLSFLQ